MQKVMIVLKQSASESIEAMSMFFCLVGAMLLVFLPLVGIALLADYVTNWFMLLLIPYMLLLPMLAKPLGRML